MHCASFVFIEALYATPVRVYRMVGPILKSLFTVTAVWFIFNISVRVFAELPDVDTPFSGTATTAHSRLVVDQLAPGL